MNGFKDYQGRIFTGLLIIGVGIIFLLSSLDKLDVGDVFSTYWPLILIFIGLWNLLANNFRNAGFGIILILVGTFFMLLKWDILGANIWRYFWPLLIIAVGLWILFKPRFIGFKGRVPKIADDDLGAFIIFSGINRRIESKEFRGGKATAMFGGIELDMTQTQLAGNQATIELTAIFGGVEIWVPREWKVVVDSNAIFGSVEDKHRSIPEQEAKTTLFVKATAIFGGIEIKN